MAVLSVPSSMSWSLLIVNANRSSWESVASCSWEIPSFSNSSLPDCAALASVFMEGFSASIEVPQCCMMKSHS